MPRPVPCLPDISLSSRLHMSPPSPALTYADFWQCRGRQSFWLTRHVSYRLGAALALLARRIGVTPRGVTALSFVAGVGGACLIAIFPEIPQWWGGCILFITLHLAYALDCADGVLARATGTTSRSGALLDKMADLLSSMFIPGILGIAAFQNQSTWADNYYHVFLIWWSLTPRLALTTMTWLKEGMTPEIDRKRDDDARQHTVFWKLKKLAGNIQDDVIYRTGIAVSWAFGCYWDFILVFQTFCCLLLIVYLVTSYRDISDAEKGGNV
jgi:phosphatidylglycerophosphate synthase